MIFGAHVSVAGGYDKALDYARSVGCECMQIFAKSPRQWRGPALDHDAVERFRDLRQGGGFGPLFTHTAYLINLSTTKDELYEKSIAALGDELARGSALGAAGVVTHIGNVPEGDREAAAQRVAAAILRAFAAAGGEECRTRLLLENTAGAGSTYGSSFEEIGAVIEASGLDADRLGMCFDTCHGWAFGYRVDSEAGWESTIDELERFVGVDRLGLIHANDCKYDVGTNHDRHEWIGDGFIGTGGFSAMICEKRLASVPVVTEMPGDIPDKDAVNIERLKALRARCGT